MFRSIPEGRILVTAPNSMALHKIPGNLQRLHLFHGYGIKVDEILSTMTYGHHWKEYSVPELRHYFQLLDSSIPIEIRSVPGTDTYEGPPFEALNGKADTTISADQIEVSISMQGRRRRS